MTTLHKTFAIVVQKLGGSVLTEFAAYARAATALRDQLQRNPAERIVVVVSAQLGTTDQLAALATEACPTPDPALQDLLWSTGELHSVALLALHLRRLGVDAVGLNIHQCGLVCAERTEAGPELNALPLFAQLSRHPIVIVPGFFARGPEDAVISLGRGGSDLSAVLLAVGLGARRCELIKDVPGYFSKDPNRFADALPLPQVDYVTALGMAASGCDLVQVRALELAAEAGLPLLIRSLEPDGRQTVVGETAFAESLAEAALAG